MAKKAEPKKDIVEREYIIPLREKCRSVPRYRKTEKAMKSVKEFIARHMKIYDKDFSKIKIDKYLNEVLWSRGIRNPPHKIKVKAIKDSEGIVKVELVDYPERLKFKKAREEKALKSASDVSQKKKAEKKEEVKEEKPEDVKKEEEEKKEVEKEKKAAVVEAGRELEKAAAKQMIHQKGGKNKQPKHEKRFALQK